MVRAYQLVCCCDLKLVNAGIFPIWEKWFVYEWCVGCVEASLHNSAEVCGPEVFAMHGPPALLTIFGKWWNQPWVCLRGIAWVDPDKAMLLLDWQGVQSGFARNLCIWWVGGDPCTASLRVVAPSVIGTPNAVLVYPAAA